VRVVEPTGKKKSRRRLRRRRRRRRRGVGWPNCGLD